MGKKTNIFKLKAKQIMSIALTSTIMFTTAIPVDSVYADDAQVVGTLNIHSSNGSSINGQATGESRVLGGAYDTSFNIGDMGGDSVRAYIYDTKKNEFVQGQYGTQTFEAIDFLGSNSIGLFNQIKDWEADVSKETAFKMAENVVQIDEYPFPKSYVDIGNNNYKSNTYEITEWLKDNNAVNLASIVEKYWGSVAYNKLRRDGSLIFVVEPLQIVSSLDDNGYLTKENATQKIETITNHLKKFYGVPIALTNHGQFDFHNREVEYTTKEIDGQTVDVTTTYYSVSDDDAELIQAINEAHGNALEYIADLKNPLTEGGNTKPDYLVINHFDTIDEAWESKVTTYLSQNYRYKLGTARYFMQYTEQSAKEYNSGTHVTSQLDVPSYYNVPDWSGKAVFTEHIGKDGKYDKNYNLVFPTEVIRSADGTITGVNWYGDDTALEINGVPTTWGMAILAPGNDASIWHTNDYKTDIPSGVPTEDRPNYPNDAYQYGNNIVEKIYEIRDKETDEIKATTSVITTGIGDTIEIEEEYIGETGTGSKCN